MNRGAFIRLLGGATAVWPIGAPAQPGQLRRVGIFMDLSEQDQEGQTRVAAFRKGMQDLGWIEGRNLRSDIRWTADDPARMRRYAAELVGLGPEVIMNGGLPQLLRPSSPLTMLLSRHTRRRQFITLLGGAAAWPLAANAQQPQRIPQIGVLMGVAESDPGGQARIAAFQQGLADLGWTVGRNIHLEYRWAAGDIDRTRAYAAELVALAPEVLVGNGTPALTALRDATRSIPIVFVVVNDPVGQGFIANLARPGGNITGFSFLEYSMVGKSLELLKQLAPSTHRFAVMFNPETTPHYTVFLRSFETVPPPRPLEIKATPIGTEADIEQAVAQIAREPGGGLIVPPDTFTMVHRGLIIRTAAQHRVPAIFSYRQFVREGALIAYGPDTTDIFQRSASYVDRILKGANPGDLPVQAPNKFELAINVKTARRLGLELPPTLLGLADEIIE
jgi:putative ABC transport system substrate-binding protein